MRLRTSLKMVRFNEDGKGRGPRCYCHTCSKHESGVYVFFKKPPTPFETNFSQVLGILTQRAKHFLEFFFPLNKEKFIDF